jgi:hypothetical protein
MLRSEFFREGEVSPLEMSINLNYGGLITLKRNPHAGGATSWAARLA